MSEMNGYLVGVFFALAIYGTWHVLLKQIHRGS